LLLPLAFAAQDIPGFCIQGHKIDLIIIFPLSGCSNFAPLPANSPEILEKANALSRELNKLYEEDKD
jgi:hypothetical protein